MLFKLTTIVALLLLFLTGTTLADSEYNKCYGAGMSWAELGTDDEISHAMDYLCLNHVGRMTQGDSFSACVMIKNNHVDTKFWLKTAMKPNTTAYVSLESCQDAFSQLKTRCKRGGELHDIVVIDKDDGGEWMNTRVKADPNKGVGAVGCFIPGKR
ncbi:hypothetical protein Daus18300_002253 [Diaporthe australafricana]|uniref:Ecp2 effector protein domain-containing protein n=1 Tax=Diaporthe australafricana TaxID=127596 RepID=A0ABR3XPH6_9PEZI